ncbi:hypothetical protein V6N13_107207 [Hibiscus sabdariffa]
MHEARSLPTHTTISPLTCPLRTSSSIHTHRSTTHTTERFGRGAEETMSEGTPQPLGTIKSEKRVNPQISCREGNRVGWVTQQQYPLRLDQVRCTDIRWSTHTPPIQLPRRGSRTPPTDWAWPGLGLAERCISHSKGTLPDIGNLVMESLAAPPKRFLALRPTMPGEFDIVRDPKATLPLTIPRRVFKSSAKDSTRRSVEITLQGGTHDLSDARATPTTRALGGQRPLLRVGNRATGACVASSPDSDLEAFSHNPAHGSFAPLAFQPSAMTNCANQRFLSY